MQCNDTHATAGGARVCEWLHTLRYDGALDVLRYLCRKKNVPADWGASQLTGVRRSDSAPCCHAPTSTPPHPCSRHMPPSLATSSLHSETYGSMHWMHCVTLGGTHKGLYQVVSRAAIHRWSLPCYSLPFTCVACTQGECHGRLGPGPLANQGRPRAHMTCT